MQVRLPPSPRPPSPDLGPPQHVIIQPPGARLGGTIVDVMRFTIIDVASRVSFVAPCPVLDALVAACAQQPTTLVELLDDATPFAPDLKDRVLSGLAVFDE